MASSSFDPKPAYSGESSPNEKLPVLEGFDKLELPKDAPANLLDSSPFNSKQGGGKGKDLPSGKEEPAAGKEKPSGDAKLPAGKEIPPDSTSPLNDNSVFGSHALPGNEKKADDNATKPVEETKSGAGEERPEKANK